MRADDLESLQEALSVWAFEMMLHEQHRHDYTVRQGEIRDFAHSSRNRYVRHDDVREREWDRLQQDDILTNTVLTDRCILEGNDQRMLGFRSRKWMEFFAGLYLARFASEQCAQQARPFANDSVWYWAWRFAIELPATPLRPHEARPFQDEVLCRSLSALFARPERGRRPSELIYRAWHLFEVDPLIVHQLPFIDSPGDPLANDAARQQLEQEGSKLLLRGAETVLAEFREQFKAWLNATQDQPDFQRPPAEIAHELLAGFVRCPPERWRYPNDRARDPCEFWMGSPEGVGRR